MRVHPVYVADAKPDYRLDFWQGLWAHAYRETSNQGIVGLWDYSSSSLNQQAV